METNTRYPKTHDPKEQKKLFQTAMQGYPHKPTSGLQEGKSINRNFTSGELPMPSHINFRHTAFPSLRKDAKNTGLSNVTNAQYRQLPMGNYGYTSTYLHGKVYNNNTFTMTLAVTTSPERKGKILAQ